MQKDNWDQGHHASVSDLLVQLIIITTNNVGQHAHRTLTHSYLDSYIMIMQGGYLDQVKMPVEVIPLSS